MNSFTNKPNTFYVVHSTTYTTETSKKTMREFNDRIWLSVVPSY